jgi:NTE family protein
MLAIAVGASSAFPPILSPAVLRLEPGVFVADSTTDLQAEPYTREVVLSDGGVYDNLGLETAWNRYKTILVSDGGGKMQADPKPGTDWARHSLRINEIIDNQVRSLRKRQLIEAFKRKTEHEGAYWGIRTLLRDFPRSGNLDCPPDKTLELARTPTRLKAFDSRYQERLMNWGYAVCAAAIENHVQPSPAVPAAFPYSGGI